MKKGTVIKSTGSWYLVKENDGEPIPCRIKGKFRLDDLKSTNPVAVGDKVSFETDPGTGNGVIAEIAPRKNFIIRKATNLSKQSQILAANIDQAILLVTINYPITTTIFIDRFLTSAEAFNIPVTLLFNKVDRYDEKHLRQMKELKVIYENIGYKTMALSAKTQDDLSEVKALLTDKTTMISGHSGVGKSTLINRLEPGLNLKTRELSESHHTGKHTTTFAEMHPFSFGGYVIDTPGIRGFGLIMIEKEELYHYFREIFAVSHKCQFHNCTHLHEPGCAVKKAVEEEEIAFSRYNSYISILLNKDEKYR
ncbi:ribosome small subunit-dependent GTPase A [Alkalitalea saponilacus]|uniref:Small ribosomal subunit biogenesis GTPase RsgA n=1 Tax=Alkalitalea saponilacus TaxID=889453 RepID=A0A1T5HME1_9BACT|nr:ribosome small subunit-dependent GTPase A [Alkalitalea saponilacus]ASB51120.1 ribosome small subunit-dependent GTPase A [Alkalitalea saponilacus]SKC21865.1 ribosome biogenesis GTPase [Alkalitalea saponilacus]